MSPEAQAIISAVLSAWPAAPLAGPYKLIHLQMCAYRLDHSSGSLFVKVVPRGDPLGMNEIHIGQTLLTAGDIPTPRLILATTLGDAALACWEWLDGTDLRMNDRHLLPEAFALLGRFHLARRHNGPVISPTTRARYRSTKELLDAELAVLCDGFSSDVKSACGHRLAVLERGYPTWIHGDMHPGNLLVTAYGLQFVDWGYAAQSLNVFDLDYVYSIALGDEEPPWWNVQPAEATAVLRAYAQACGLPFRDMIQLHHAVMLWTELRSRYNAMRNGNQQGAIQYWENVSALLNNPVPAE